MRAGVPWQGRKWQRLVARRWADAGSQGTGLHTIMIRVARLSCVEEKEEEAEAEGARDAACRTRTVRCVLDSSLLVK